MPTYSLRTNFSDYTSDEISISLFEKHINILLYSGVYDFMVLCADKPIQHSTFIQAVCPEEITDYKFIIEIGFHDNQSELEMYRYYNHNQDDVLQYFIDYWKEQKIPDISSWEDVSWELRG